MPTEIATGAEVLIAVIDLQIDTAHPDLSGAIAASYDAVGNREKPDEHGTEMTGAIVAHRKLLGVAPRARILAIRCLQPRGAKFGADHHGAHPRRHRLGDRQGREGHQHELCRPL